MRRFARFALVALVCLVICSCTATGGTGGIAVPISATGTVKGEATGPVVKIAGVPMNALVRIQGDYTWTIQAFPPYATLDGDYTIIVEPIPGMELDAQHALESGDLLIRRSGKASGLNAPGSIRAYKASARALKSYVVRPPAAPIVQNPTSPPPVPSAYATCCDPNDPTCCVPTSSSN